MGKALCNYELMIIFKPLLPDDVRKKSHKAILDLVKDLGGSVETADVWGKRYLSYRIKGHDEGYYILYQFKLPSEGLLKLNVGIKRIPEVLRLLIARIECIEKVSAKLNKKVIEI
jgi:small subunit ribosomal protein S6